MGNLILWLIAILAFPFGWGMCAMMMSSKLTNFESEITYQKIQTEQAYQEGWNEAIRSMQKIARNKLSAGGVRECE